MPKIFYNFNKSKSITTDIQTDKLSNVSVDTFHEFAVGFYHVVQLAKNLHRLDGESKKKTTKNKKKTWKRRGSDVMRVLEISDDILYSNKFLISFMCNSKTKSDLRFYLHKFSMKSSNFNFSCMYHFSFSFVI